MKLKQKADSKEISNIFRRRERTPSTEASVWISTCVWNSFAARRTVTATLVVAGVVCVN